MGLKENLDHALEGVKEAAVVAADKVKDAIDNVKDAASEAGHRATAQGEQTKRDVAGDQMTVGEHVGSVANQATNTVQAEIDKSKQDLRNNT